MDASEDKVTITNEAQRRGSTMKTEAQLKKIIQSLKGLDPDQACDVIKAIVDQNLIFIPNWYTKEHLESCNCSPAVIELLFRKTNTQVLAIAMDNMLDDFVAEAFDNDNEFVKNYLIGKGEIVS
jgi:hypothetical protein